MCSQRRQNQAFSLPIIKPVIMGNYEKRHDFNGYYQIQERSTPIARVKAGKLARYGVGQANCPANPTKIGPGLWAEEFVPNL
jgi:hypothetical protein